MKQIHIEAGYMNLFIALILPDKIHPGNSPRLIMMNTGDVEEGVYVPPASVSAYGESTLIAIRDALIAAFPVQSDQDKK